MVDQPPLRYGFAGDRRIAVEVLTFLLRRGHDPELLLVSGSDRASHDLELIRSCPSLPSERILRGAEFRDPAAVAILEDLDLDFIFGIHFPYIVPKKILNIPRHGVLNLHPSYLPYNRGWHTPSWAILENTPIGATLHFMTEELDAGDIIHQRKLEVRPDDTADSLYERLNDLEFQVFEEAWPRILARDFDRTPQDPEQGTSHRRSDLFQDSVQRIDLDAKVRSGDLLRQLRALTTNSLDEAAYFEHRGRRYRVQVKISEEESHDSDM